MTAEPATICEVEDCYRPTHSRSRFCAGHAKRVERGAPVSSPLRENLTLRERCLKLAIDLADCDAEDDQAFERCWDALEHALTEWADVRAARRAGRARFAKMTPEARSAYASALARRRWKMRARSTQKARTIHIKIRPPK